jgi:hypothetical protein
VKFIAGVMLLALLVIPAQLAFSQPVTTMTLVFDTIKVLKDHDKDGFFGHDDGEWNLSAVINAYKKEGTKVGDWGVDLSYPGSGMNDVRDGETVRFDTSQTSRFLIVPTEGTLQILLSGLEDDGDDPPDALGIINVNYSGPVLLNGLGLHSSAGNLCREITSSSDDYTIKFYVDSIDGSDCDHVIGE